MITFLLVIIYLSFVALGFPDSLLGGAWALMRFEIGANTEFAGILAFVVSLFTVISSLFASRFLQKYGTGKVTFASVLSTAIGLMGYSISQNPLMLIPCAIFLGLGAGAVDAALSNYVALHLEAKHMSWLHCSWGIGAMTGTYIMAAYFLSEEGMKAEVAAACCSLFYIG